MGLGLRVQEGGPSGLHRSQRLRVASGVLCPEVRRSSPALRDSPFRKAGWEALSVFLNSEAYGLGGLRIMIGREPVVARPAQVPQPTEMNRP